MNTLDGKLPENILLFTRLLRASGIRIGSEGVTDSIEAIQSVGLRSRGEFYFSLLTCLTKRKEDEIIFRQAFDLFWQNPKFQEKQRNMLLPRTRVSENNEIVCNDSSPFVRLYSGPVATLLCSGW